MDEEKKGFFGKVQEKYKAHKEAADQKKQEELEKEKRKVIDEVTSLVNKYLKDIISVPVEFKPTSIGATFGLAGGFTTTDNIPVVSFITIEHILQPAFSEARFFPMNYIFGSYADRSVPISMIAKKLSTGFVRSERLLIPFQPRPQFDAKAIWKNKIDWNPLLDAINNDKQLIAALSSLPNQTTVLLSSKRMLTYKIEDQNEINTECLCQIIPFKTLSFIGIRALGLSLRDKTQLNNVINLFRMIRGHILSYGHALPTAGHIAQDWIKVTVSLMSDYFPPIKQEIAPEPTEKIEVGEIGYFGDKQDYALKLISVFNVIRRREPENLNAFVAIRQRLAKIIDQDEKSLLEALKSKEIAVRTAALTALGKYSTPDTMETLKQASKSPDIFEASSAFDSLGATEQKTITPFLIQALKDPIAQKRATAAYALSQLQDESAIDALTVALSDAEIRVQKIAAFALVKIRVQQIKENRVGKEVVEEALKKLLSHFGVDTLASLATGKEQDIKIDATDIYPGQATAELLTVLYRRFLVVVKAHKKTAGEKKQSFSYAVDAEDDEEAVNKVVEAFNKQQGIEGFVIDGPVEKPFDMTAAGAGASQECPLGALIRPVWLKEGKKS